MRTSAWVWIVLLGIVGACNGSGSGGPPPLRVTSQSPAPGSIVEPDASVRLVFDRDPDLATLSADALVVGDAGGTIPGSHSYDAATRTWTWIADDELPRGALLTAVVAESVRTVERGGVLGLRSWSFRVRQAAPSAPLLVRTQAVASSGVFVGMHGAGDAFVAAGSEFWEVGRGAVGLPESMPVVQVGRMLVDADGGVAVAGGLLGPGTTVAGFCRRSLLGFWNTSTVIQDDPAATLVGYRLLGNAHGEVVLHGLLGYPPAAYTRHHLRRATVAAPFNWQYLPEILLQGGDDVLACIDDRGFVATLRDDGDYVLAARHDPSGAIAVYTVAQGQFLRVESLSTSADGHLRALWQAPGGVKQSFAAPDEGFAPASDVTVPIPAWSNWRSAPTGAIVGWNGPSAFRSEAGSLQWRQVALDAEPMAAAMSPRGEAVFVYFILPDQLMMQRWRPGEEIAAPVPIAVIPSAFNAQRRADVAVDGAGRVVVAFVPGVPGDLVAIRVE
ncbi:MAG: Ig-like domain-containing protein [Planctomycetes bacterium]|nr:Ig-like domain-containing protein [Planctomycetota bacterium]MCB9884846.1 Ig-like domain-containing protein [Planctomycetota bacterium]